MRLTQTQLRKAVSGALPNYRFRHCGWRIFMNSSMPWAGLVRKLLKAEVESHTRTLPVSAELFVAARARNHGQRQAHWPDLLSALYSCESFVFRPMHALINHGVVRGCCINTRQKERRPAGRLFALSASPGDQTIRLRRVIAGFSKLHSTTSPGFR